MVFFPLLRHSKLIIIFENTNKFIERNTLKCFQNPQYIYKSMHYSLKKKKKKDIIEIVCTHPQPPKKNFSFWFTVETWNMSGLMVYSIYIHDSYSDIFFFYVYFVCVQKFGPLQLAWEMRRRVLSTTTPRWLPWGELCIEVFICDPLSLLKLKNFC